MHLPLTVEQPEKVIIHVALLCGFKARAEQLAIAHGEGAEEALGNERLAEVAYTYL